MVMLTFDKIRELERVERDSKKLQRLPDDIIEQLGEYLKRKERIKEKTTADIIELENVKSTVKRFFELRESKLLLSALDTVRTGMPPENMTKQEENVFYQLVDKIKQFREDFFRELQKRQEQNVYRVKKSLPEFVGPDMRIYKLNENELVTLPKEVEELLVSQGIVEKVEDD